MSPRRSPRLPPTLSPFVRHAALALSLVGCSGADRPPSLSGDASTDARADIAADRADAYIECLSDLNCDDRVACTIDRCVAGRCDHEPQSTRCGAGGRCDPVAGCVGQRACMTDRDCPDDPCATNEQCDPLSRVCVQEDLPAASPCGPVGAGRLCRGGACVCPMARPNPCGDACVDVATDPSHCGACGVRCGAGAWCDAGRCACSSPQTYCAGGCVDTAADPLNCGACGARCGAGGRCEAGRCRTPCAAGTHRCGEVCVSDTAVTSCGTSCEACPAPTHGTAVCAAGTCLFTCATGFHVCGARCADDTALDTCGASCSPCPTDAHGTMQCVMGACRPTCNAGYHACGGVCVSDAAVDSCGTSCTPCASPERGDAVCVAGRCDFTCRAGTYRCADVCTDGNSPLGCGPGCIRCPVPDNGAATCTAGVCGRSCFPGFHRCGELCLNDNLPASCGTSCTPCPTVVNAESLCLAGGVCGFQCSAGFVRVGEACRALPRLVAPRSTARLTGRRPTLSWVLPSDATEGTVQLCRDRACGMVIRSLPATAGTTALTEDLPAGVVFWRVAAGDGRQSATWTFVVPNHATAVTSEWGASQDVNADGYSDLIVARPFAPTGGSVFVMRGASDGLSGPTFEVTDDTPASYFGQSVAFAGDPDGDGYGDVLVGAPGYIMSQGRAALYRGGATGLTNAPTRVFYGPYGVDSFYGSAVAAGDFDGDGFTDVAIGAYGAAGSAGRVEVFRGGASGLTSIPTIALSGAPGSRYGISLATLGDVNADGYEDLAVGADGAVGFSGRVYIHLGSAMGLSNIANGELRSADAGQFGLTLSAAGDVNGDGYPDVAVGAPEALAFGRVYVFLGGLMGVSPTVWATLSTPLSVDGSYGAGLAGVGDVNADGFDDLVIGAPRTNTSEGLALYLPGGAMGFGSPVRLPGATGARPYFGNAVGGARDLDADGYDDIAVGAERFTSFLGQVSIFRGGATGPRPPILSTPPAGGLNGRYGFAISQ